MPTRRETKIWRSLARRKGRDETGAFLLEGPRLLEEALNAGRELEVVLHRPGAEEDGAVRDLLNRARAGGARVEEVSGATLESVADAETPQGVLAVAPIPRWGWDDIGPGLVVLLDGVQDPGNVGTVARSAAALGCAGVVGLDGTADPWGPKAVRAAAGAGLRMPLFRSDRPAALVELQHRGLPVWVADAAGEPLPRGEVGARAPRLALVFGSEAHGVSDEVRRVADRTVGIPLARGAESLNVAAAAAILIDRAMQTG